MASSRAAQIDAEPVAVESTAPPVPVTTVILIAVVTIAALYFGRDIFIPLALALLISFALGPLVTRLDRLGLGRIPSVLATAFCVFLVLTGLGLAVVSQVSDLVVNVSRYEYTLREKIRTVREGLPQGSVFERAIRSWNDIRAELEGRPNSREAAAEPQPQAEPQEEKPVPVKIQEGQGSGFEWATTIAASVLPTLAVVGIVFVFVIFMLIGREDLRDRIIRLAGTGDLSRTTEALDEAAHRVSKFLLAQLFINVSYGICVGLGLWLIGLPNPLLFALLGTVLRFIPYLGPVISATFPIVLSLAVFPSMHGTLMVLGLFIVLELFVNNVLEPLLYGATTGLSTMAVLVAAVFWTTLWGSVGLLLAMPLTVCVVVLGRHVPQLEFLDVLLGAQSPLPVEAKIYQRLLVDDLYEAGDEADEHVKENGLESLYDQILLRVLSLALADRYRRAITSERFISVATHVATIAEEAAELDFSAPEAAARRRDAESERVSPDEPVVLCVGGRHAADNAAAWMLMELLHRRQINATLVRSDEPEGWRRSAPEDGRVDAVILCYVAPSSLTHAERLVRRLRHRLSAQAPIMVAIPHARRELLSSSDISIDGADGIARSLAAATKLLGEMLSQREESAEQAQAGREASVSAAG